MGLCLFCGIGGYKMVVKKGDKNALINLVDS